MTTPKLQRCCFFPSLKYTCNIYLKQCLKLNNPLHISWHSHIDGMIVGCNRHDRFGGERLQENERVFYGSHDKKCFGTQDMYTDYDFVQLKHIDLLID